jgi:hypothetical protein
MFKVHSNALAVFNAALAKGQGRILSAVDAGGALRGAIFYVWDGSTTYYLLSTRTPEGHNGIVSRLIWEAIRESTSNGRTFDFDGVGTKGSVLFYAGFGGLVRPRYIVHRISAAYQAVMLPVETARGILSQGKLPLFRRDNNRSSDV